MNWNLVTGEPRIMSGKKNNVEPRIFSNSIKMFHHKCSVYFTQRLLFLFSQKLNAWKFILRAKILNLITRFLNYIFTSFPNVSRKVQSGKTYCVAFCASRVALLAGSGYNAIQAAMSCTGSQWLETAADYNKLREGVAQLIYLCLGKHEILPEVSPCLLRGSLAYIFSGLLLNMQYVKSVCG